MRTFQAAGHSVYGTYQTASNPALLHFDLDEPQAIVPLLENVRPDAVISCLRGDFTRQMEAHRLLADCLFQHHGRLIYLSTANVFDGDLSRPHYEGDTLCSDSAYGQFKIACERYLQKSLSEDCVILRLPEIWGWNCPRLHALVKSTRKGDPVRTYENMSVNYTTDAQIAQWVSFILEHDLRGVFHVGTKDTSDYTAFLDCLTERLSLPRPVYDVELNKNAAYQAVLPDRSEIPEGLQLSVQDVLNYLSEAPTL